MFEKCKEHLTCIPVEARAAIVMMLILIILPSVIAGICFGYGYLWMRYVFGRAVVDYSITSGQQFLLILATILIGAVFIIVTVLSFVMLLLVLRWIYLFGVGIASLYQCILSLCQTQEESREESQESLTLIEDLEKCLIQESVGVPRGK